MSWRAPALGALFVLLSLSMGISAYEYMQVSIGASVDIVTPENANIAIVPGSDTVKGPSATAHKVCQVNSDTNMISCDFGPWAKGMTFKSMAAFTVTNYDDEEWKFWFDTSDLPTGVSITFMAWDGSTWNQITQDDPLTIASGGSATVGVVLTIDNTASLGTGQTFTIMMNGMESGAAGTPSAPGAPES